MLKKLKEWLPVLIVFAAGMATYGVVQTSLVIGLGRASAMGGEVLLLPLMAVMIAIGWMFGKRRGAILRKNMLTENWMDGYRHGVKKAELRTGRSGNDGQIRNAVL